MSDTKRMHIREKIEAGLARQEKRDGMALGERAQRAREGLASAASEHPLLLIAGGLIIGAALSTLIPRSPTRKYGKYAFTALTTLGELGIAYGKHALDAAEDAAGDAVHSGKEKVGTLKSKLADRRAAREKADQENEAGENSAEELNELKS